MTKQLADLIDTAFNVKVFFQLESYELHQYEDGSFVDFHVRKVVDLRALIKVANGHELKFYGGDCEIMVRLFEKASY